MTDKTLLFLEEMKCNDCDFIFYISEDNSLDQENIRCPICKGETINPRNLVVERISEEIF